MSGLPVSLDGCLNQERRAVADSEPWNHLSMSDSSGRSSGVQRTLFPGWLLLVGEQLVAAVVWIGIACLTLWLMPTVAQMPVDILWPANAVAYGAIIVFGWRLIPGFAIGALVHKVSIGFVSPNLIIGIFTFVAVMLFVAMLNRLLTYWLGDAFQQQLVRISLIAFTSAALFTALGVYQFGATPSAGLMLSLWMAEASSVLLFTPLVQRWLQRDDADRRHAALLGIRRRTPGWVVAVWVSAAVLLLALQWWLLNYATMSLQSLLLMQVLPLLVFPLTAVFLLGSAVRAMLMSSSFLLVWAVMQYHCMIGGARCPMISLDLEEQLPLFAAALVAFLANEFSYTSQRTSRALRLERFRDDVSDLLNDPGLHQLLRSHLREPGSSVSVITVYVPDVDDLAALIGHEQSQAIERDIAGLICEATHNHERVARLQPGLFSVVSQEEPDATYLQTQRIQSLLSKARAENRFYNGHLAVQIGQLDHVTAQDIDQLLSAQLLVAQRSEKEVDGRPYRYGGAVGGLIDTYRGSLRWVQRMRAAMAGDGADGHFELYCQPIVDQSDPDFLQVEILLRWVAPDGRLLGAGEFLPIAEDFGLMPLVDRWVMERTIGLIAGHPQGARLENISINLSGECLAYTRVDRSVAQLLETYDWPGERLCFEITESMVIRDTRQARENIMGLRALGCRIAVDDFGTGQATFAYLKHYPFDRLKIDGSFIRDVADSPVDQAIVRAIVTVAREMGATVIAEFVENERQIVYLEQFGVHQLQGFGIACPQPLGDYLDGLA
jgi:EAL domain-containing protein (putative c-di-GMP-specific phosphodiesterase class I)/GGDEF domain-containing protein